MSTHPCGGCSRALTDAYLCDRCGSELADRLHGVRALVDELEIALSRQTRIGDGAGIRVRDAETPLAFDWAAAEALWLLHRAVVDWSARIATVWGTAVAIELPHVLTDPKDPARIFPRRGRIAGAAAWLADRVHWAAALPDVADLLEEIDYALTTATRVIDRPAERVYLSQCGMDTDDGPCQIELFAAPKAWRVICPGCAFEHDVAERRSLLLARVADVLVTATEASRALPTLLGCPVTASQIRGHAHRGNLVPWPTPPGRGRLPNGHPVVVYRLADVVAVLVAEGAERDARNVTLRAPAC